MHTIRWLAPSAGTTDTFAPHGRNAEDLGVEIFSPSSTFNLSFPLIAAASKVVLPPGSETVCSYDMQTQRYCPPLKAVLTAAGHTTAAAGVLRPRMSFSLSALSGCSHGESVHRHLILIQHLGEICACTVLADCLLMTSFVCAANTCVHACRKLPIQVPRH